jgi:rubrerythrin
MTLDEYKAMTNDEKAHEDMMKSWIEDGYKKGKGFGDWRKKIFEDDKKEGRHTSPEIPIEEVDSDDIR